MAARDLGPLVRLWGIPYSQLPAADAGPDDLAPFLISVLQEAVPFVDSVAPKGPLPTESANSNGAVSATGEAAPAELALAEPATASTAPSPATEAPATEPATTAAEGAAAEPTPAPERPPSVNEDGTPNTSGDAALAAAIAAEEEANFRRSHGTRGSDGFPQPAALIVSSSSLKHSSSKPLWRPKGTKRFPSSAALVVLSERVVPAAELELVAALRDRGESPSQHRAGVASETWACRRSVHVDSAAPGGKTASWAEFDDTLRMRHAETERAVTPAIVAHREGGKWEGERFWGGVEVEEGGFRWGDARMAWGETRHKVGGALKDRVFPVLTVSARVVGWAGEAAGADLGQPPNEFIVVNIPVTDIPSPLPDGQQQSLVHLPHVVVGAYVSVERVRKMSAAPDSDIEWIMATASEAGGMLPHWVQTLAVPGQIAKDVGLFLSWIDGQRQKGSSEGETGAGASAGAEAAGGEAVGKERVDSTPEKTAVAAAAPEKAKAKGKGKWWARKGDSSKASSAESSATSAEPSKASPAESSATSAGASAATAPNGTVAARETDVAKPEASGTPADPSPPVAAAPATNGHSEQNGKPMDSVVGKDKAVMVA